MPTADLTQSAREPEGASAHYNMGNVLQRQGLLAQAVASYRKALLLRPDYAEACNNMGVALQALGQLDEAVDSLRRALLFKPGYSAHNNLGNALQARGEFAAAIEHYRHALQLRPDQAEAWNNMGNALQALRQTDAATQCYQKALALNPHYAEAHYNLGNALQAANLFEGAQSSYMRALELKPDYADARNNLALLFNMLGNAPMALSTVVQSLQNPHDENAKGIFVVCASRMVCRQDDAELRKLVTRALAECWGRAGDLARLATDLIQAGHDFGPCITRANQAWPAMLAAAALFAPDGSVPDVSGALPEALLVSTSVADIALERFLTMARHVLLQAAISGTDTASSFYSALARQCFINEYVFYCGDDEMHKAGELRDALAAVLEGDRPVSALVLLAVAAYFPLYTVPHAGRLLQRTWPAAVQAVLVQQISEPEEERRLRATIPRLTAIEDDVSRRVQQQYEENPYPRWVQPAPAAKVESVSGYLRRRFPDVPIGQSIACEYTDVLIAGCGTGQQSLEAARKFRGARVLAVDLSLSSLAYAKRKTQELGVDAIEYAQADLLKLGALGRSFDLIESVGVLHHLAQPFEGWRALLPLLRPGGFMRLGFYSELARRHIVRAQAYVAAQGYGSTANDIRRCRQDLLNSGKAQEFGGALTTADFFSISSCRDLLFHVQERRLTLVAIDEFIRENKLLFLGFEIESDVVEAYRTRFPDDQAATDLGNWQIFETENPDTFFGMYQFWVQRGA
jgi:tetratricopeptide (TPR) repeat protein/2-polyprenyl-3-methyl-5-hydroxy-6-metoxy-1,4-benzoquinol methylase